jgi:predicted metal-dependent hydrolase
MLLSLSGRAFDLEGQSFLRAVKAGAVGRQQSKLENTLVCSNGSRWMSTTTTDQPERRSTAGRTVAAAREIAPRRAKFTLGSDTPRYWLSGDPYVSHVLNALSLTFPEGERLFIVSVRDLAERLQDPLLARQVRGFLAQESLHRRVHAAFNEWLRALGVDVDRYYAEIAALLQIDQPEGARDEEFWTRRRAQLAVTCALEHFTAVLAELWLTRDDLRLGAHPDVRPLWTWHSIEELDHKSVAFDVYQATGGSYALRVLIMASVTVGFLWKVSSIHTRLMRDDGQRDPRTWLRGLWRCWGPRGYFSTLLPAYLRYFRPDFHPWQHDDSALVRRFERELTER